MESSANAAEELVSTNKAERFDALVTNLENALRDLCPEEDFHPEEVDLAFEIAKRRRNIHDDGNGTKSHWQKMHASEERAIIAEKYLQAEGMVTSLRILPSMEFYLPCTSQLSDSLQWYWGCLLARHHQLWKQGKGAKRIILVIEGKDAPRQSFMDFIGGLPAMEMIDTVRVSINSSPNDYGRNAKIMAALNSLFKARDSRILSVQNCSIDSTFVRWMTRLLKKGKLRGLDFENAEPCDGDGGYMLAALGTVREYLSNYRSIGSEIELPNFDVLSFRTKETGARLQRVKKCFQWLLPSHTLLHVGEGLRELCIQVAAVSTITVLRGVTDIITDSRQLKLLDLRLEHHPLTNYLGHPATRKLFQAVEASDSLRDISIYIPDLTFLYAKPLFMKAIHPSSKIKRLIISCSISDEGPLELLVSDIFDMLNDELLEAIALSRHFSPLQQLSLQDYNVTFRCDISNRPRPPLGTDGLSQLDCMFRYFRRWLPRLISVDIGPVRFWDGQWTPKEPLGMVTFPFGTWLWKNRVGQALTESSSPDNNSTIPASLWPCLLDNAAYCGDAYGSRFPTHRMDGLYFLVCEMNKHLAQFL